MNKRFLQFFLCASGLLLLGASCSSSRADGGVFFTQNFGKEWEQRNYVGQQKKKVVTIGSVDVQKIELDPKNSQNIYLGTKANGLWKTNNQGVQWQQVNIKPDRIRDVEIDPIYSNNVYAVRGSSVLKSTDSGDTWEIVYTDSQNAVLTQIEIDWFNQQRLIATTSIGTVLLSEDEGRNWQVVYQVDEPLVSLILNHSDSRIMYILELDHAVHKSTDGGKTWVDLFDNKEFEAFTKTQKAENAKQVKRFAMDPNNSNVLYVITASGLLRTNDAGQSWEFVDTLIERNAPENAEMYSIAVKPGDSQTIIFSLRNLIHHSNDGGKTWEVLENFPSSRRITTLVMDPSNPDVIYAGVEGVEKKRFGFLQGPGK